MSSNTFVFRRTLAHELRLLSADRSLWLVSVILLGLFAFATRNGVVQTRARDAAAAHARAAEAAGQAAVVERLRRVMSRAEAPDPWGNPTDPSLVGGGMAPRNAILPTAPLAPLAIGQSDMYPDTYRITTKSRVEFMYDSEIENPWNLLTGRFDVAFVITYLLPLLVLAWSYNLVAAEREQGTLRMLLSQPVGLGTVVAAKVLVRSAVLLLWAVAIPVATIALLRPEARGPAGVTALACFAGLTAAYALFWFALAVIVDGFSRSSALSALALVSAWVVLALVLPVTINLIAAAISPAPSRAELATQTRVITIENLDQLSGKFRADYRYVSNPDLLLPKDGRFEVPDRLRAFFLAGQRLDQRIGQALDAFDASLARQQAIVDRLGLLSPAILAHEGLAAIAGNGTKRYQRFHHQVTAFHEEWRRFFGPRVLEGVAITEADFARMPAWTWREAEIDELRTSTLRRLGQLLVLGGLLGALAWAKLRRYRVA